MAWHAGVLPALAGCLLALVTCSQRCVAYDPLDPTGNVTIVWDVPSFSGDGYMVTVNLFNNQFFRRIQKWQLSWNWTNGEYIWSAKGAEALQQGDCSKTTFPGGNIPHCCLKTPVMADLDPPKEGDPPLPGCCKSGIIEPTAQNSPDSQAIFQLSVGNASNTIWSFKPPSNFSLGVDGYTCTEPYLVPSSVYTSATSKRQTQALVTYNAVCTYSAAPVKAPPKCCVSLSSFYNNTIIPCASCACACGNYSNEAVLCLNKGDQNAWGTPYLTSDGGDGMSLQSTNGSMQCSPDGCPIKIHFHLKTNYKEYWRGKLTVINRSLWTKYSNWNVVMEHPNVANMTQVFSWNATTVQPYGVNNTAIFWGLQDYNIILNTADQGGNVQSEMLFAKRDDFTLSNGWGYPRKIMFNGEECVMPEEFPTLPNAAFQLPTIVAAACSVVAALLALAVLL